MIATNDDVAINTSNVLTLPFHYFWASYIFSFYYGNSFDDPVILP